MSDHPTPLNDDDLAKVVGGAGALPSSLQKDETIPDMNSIMKLFQETAQEMRNAARETRGAELSAQVESLKGAADDMRAAAEHRMQASVVAGASQIAGGAMSLGGLGGHAMMDKSSTLHGASQDLSGGKAALAGLDTSHVGQMATGVNQSIGSTAMEAKHIEASGKITEINAAAHQTSQVQAAEQMQQMMDVIKDVKDKLASIQQSRTDTMKSIVGKI